MNSLSLHSSFDECGLMCLNVWVIYYVTFRILEPDNPLINRNILSIKASQTFYENITWQDMLFVWKMNLIQTVLDADFSFLLKLGKASMNKKGSMTKDDPSADKSHNRKRRPNLFYILLDFYIIQHIWRWVVWFDALYRRPFPTLQHSVGSSSLFHGIDQSPARACVCAPLPITSLTLTRGAFRARVQKVWTRGEARRWAYWSACRLCTEMGSACWEAKKKVHPLMQPNNPLGVSCQLFYRGRRPKPDVDNAVWEYCWSDGKRNRSLMEIVASFASVWMFCCEPPSTERKAAMHRELKQCKNTILHCRKWAPAMWQCLSINTSLMSVCHSY